MPAHEHTNRVYSHSMKIKQNKFKPHSPLNSIYNMQPSEEIENIQKLLNGGDLNHILPHLEKLLLSECPEELAMKTLVILSQSLSKSNDVIGSQENYKTILQLVHQCCSCIQCEVKSYDEKRLLTCLYYIFKYFINQDEIQEAVALKTYIILTAKDTRDNEALENIYYSCYYLAHSAILNKIKNLKGLPTRINYKLLMDIFGSALEILACCGTKHVTLILTSSVQIEALLNKSKLDDFREDGIKFHYSVLNIIQSIFDSGVIGTICDSVYQAYLILISTMLNSSIDKRRFDEVVDILEKRVSHIQLPNRMQRDCMLCYKQVLEVLLNPSLNYSVTMLEECNKLLEHLVKHSGNDTNLVITCSHLTTLCLNLQHYYAEMKIKWPLNIHIQLYRIFLNLARVLQESDHVSCTSPLSVKCPLQKERRKTVRLYVLIMQLFNNVDDHEIESVLSHHLVAQEFAIKFSETIKEEGCHLWKESWTLVAITSFNLGCDLQTKGKFYHSISIFSNFSRAFLAMEGTQESTIAIKDGLFRGLQGITRGHMNQKSYRDALLPCAVALVLLPKQYKDIMTSWVVVKKNAMSSGFHVHIQECTLFHILTEDKHKIKSLFPTIHLEDVNICQMLVWELEAYSLARTNMWEAIRAAGSALLSLSPDGLLLGKGMQILLLEMWKQPDMELSKEAVGICERTIAALNDEIQDSEGEVKQEISATTGHIHYYNFLHHMKLARDKQKKEVESLEVFPHRVERETIQGEEDPSDSNAICDITPAYDGLSVDKEAELLSLMAQAVDTWTLCLKGVPSCTPEMRTALISKILIHLETIAHTYALYGCDVYKLNAWMLYYNFSEAIGSENGVLLALSHLLEVSDEHFNSECFRKAEAIAHELEMNLSGDKYENLPLLFTYWISRSEHCLKTGRYDEGIQLLLKMKSDTVSMYPKVNMVTYARIKLLLSRYLCLSATSGIHDEYNDINAMVAVGIAFGVIQRQCKERIATMSPCENSQLLSLVMEVSDWIGELYLRLKMPRDVRCYVKTQLVLAQMLALPTRVAQFLSKLAQVDLLCSNILDCHVKLYGMESILQQIKQTRIVTSVGEKRMEKFSLYQETLFQLENLDLDDGTRSQAMHCRNPGWQNSPKASPVLNRKLFKLPDFICHRKDCKCFPCNNLLIQNLMVESTFIEAQLHVLEGNDKHARSFFEGGMQLSKMVQEFQKRLISNLSLKMFQHGNCSALNPLQNTFSVSYVKFLLFYAEFLALHCKYEDAEKLNGYAWDILKEMKTVDLHLEQDIIEQKLCFALTLFDESTHKISDPPMKEALTPEIVSTSFSDARTPYTQTNALPCKALFVTPHYLQHQYGSPPKRDIPSISVKLFSNGNAESDSYQIKKKDSTLVKSHDKDVYSNSAKTVCRNAQLKSNKSKKCYGETSENDGQICLVSSAFVSPKSTNFKTTGRSLNVEESLYDNVFESPVSNQNSDKSVREFRDGICSARTTRVYKNTHSNKNRLKDDYSKNNILANEKVSLPSYIQKSPTTLNAQSLINADILNKHARKLISDDNSYSSITSASCSGDEILPTKKSARSKSQSDMKSSKQLGETGSCDKTTHFKKSQRNKVNKDPEHGVDCKESHSLNNDELPLSCKNHDERESIKVLNRMNGPLSPISTSNRIVSMNSKSKTNSGSKEFQDAALLKREREHVPSNDVENIDPVIAPTSETVHGNAVGSKMKVPTRCGEKKIMTSTNSAKSPSIISVKLAPGSSRRGKNRLTKETNVESVQSVCVQTKINVVENSGTTTGSVVKDMKRKPHPSGRGRKVQPLNEKLNTVNTKTLFHSSTSSENSPVTVSEENAKTKKGTSPLGSHITKTRRGSQRTAEDEFVVQPRTGRRRIKEIPSSSDSSNKEPDSSPVKTPEQVTSLSSRKKATSVTKRKLKRCPYLL